MDHPWNRAALRPLLVLTLFAILFFAQDASATTTGCLSIPSACGYPDNTNSGVPANASLTNSGSMTISTNGQVINGLNVSGMVTVRADNVTIENSKIVPTSTGSGSAAILVEAGASGTVIENTTVGGKGAGSETIEAAVRNWGDGTTAERDYLYNCNECWQGDGTIRNSYMRVDSIYPGAHAEDIYVCSGAIDVDHSTLINEEHQTATVFGDTICGGGNVFSVTNSLLAGGGFLLYPQAGSSSSVGVMTVTGNRFARCTSGSRYESGSGGTSCTGSTAAGYFPYGGYYGVSAYTYTGGANAWSNNVWDDSSQPICPSGSAGCGVAVPPPTGTQPPPAPTPPVALPIEPVIPIAPTKHKEATAGASKNGSGAGAGANQGSGPSIEPPAHAVWNPPTTAPPSHRIRLNGAGSTGAMPIACVWTVSDRDGRKTLYRKRGCVSSLRLPPRGARTVRLTVTGSDAGTDSVRHTIRVFDGPPPPSLAAAQVAADF
jgi:hypothetical protein